MFGLDIWDILGILAIISLLVSFSIGKNAIWGTFTIGILICIIAGIVSLFRGGEFFNWSLFKKIAIISVLAGTIFEIIGRLTKSPKKFSQ